jgi:hypothetical protein
MPIELQIAVGVVAILSFALSLFLGWLKFEEWRAKPHLWLDMDWIVGGGAPSTLRIAAGNRGKARGAVRNIAFSPTEHYDRATAFEFLNHLADLPVMVEPGAFERFTVALDPNDDYAFTKGLLGGSLTHAILIDQDSSPHPFPIPTQPSDGDNRVSGVGRVRKK